jgi:hypothetical protein
MILKDYNPEANYAAVRIHVDPDQVEAILGQLAAESAQLPRILQTAINATATTARKEIVQTVAGAVNVSQADLRRRNITLYSASRKELLAKISITGRRIPLKSLKARQTAKGTTYAIRRGSSKTLVPHAFLGNYFTGTPATMRSGHQGVFVRRTGKQVEAIRKGIRSRLQGGKISDRLRGRLIRNFLRIHPSSRYQCGRSLARRARISSSE